MDAFTDILVETLTLLCLQEIDTERCEREVASSLYHIAPCRATPCSAEALHCALPSLHALPLTTL